MQDRPLMPKELPSDCAIVELSYRIKKAETTHLDLVISVDGAERSLRFHRPRVVQFDKDLPDVLRGLEVQDVTEKALGDCTLWVSIGHGAVTFWARDVVELSRSERLPRLFGDTAPFKPWEIIKEAEEVYNYRAPRGGAFRAFSISTKPYGDN
jgi:hypothetical protein